MNSEKMISINTWLLHGEAVSKSWLQLFGCLYAHFLGTDVLCFVLNIISNSGKINHILCRAQLKTQHTLLNLANIPEVQTLITNSVVNSSRSPALCTY